MRVIAGQRRDIAVCFLRTHRLEERGLAARAAAVLSPDERASLARLRSHAARRDSLAAHVLARLMLAEIAGVAPARLEFRRSHLGRPEIVAPRAACHLSFSLSHADGVALCAVVAGCAVGADVESLHNLGPDPLAVAGTICSRAERDALSALDESERAKRVLRLWTRTEAVTKGMGLGLSAAPGLDLSGWRVASLSLTAHHTAAVAVRCARRPCHAALRVAEAAW